jgi:hypothetical protein
MCVLDKENKEEYVSLIRANEDLLKRFMPKSEKSLPYGWKASLG